MLPRTPQPTHFPYTTLFRSTAPLTSSRGPPVTLPAVTINDGTRTAARATVRHRPRQALTPRAASTARPTTAGRDRKSTRLNSSHLVISYAVFCLKKRKYYLH